MKQTIERLRQEKAEVRKDYFEQGKEDGREWAMAASYEELQYALGWTTTKELMRHENIISWRPTDNEVLGEYFVQMIEESGAMGFTQTLPGSFVPSDNFIAWESGWAQGVREFWEEVRDRL